MTEEQTLISAIVVDCMPVGLLVIDPAGAIVTVNPEAERILGYGRVELIGKGWGQVFFQNDFNYLFNQIFLDVIQEEAMGLRREAPYIAPDGRSLRLSLISSYVKKDDADLAGIAVILHDITEIHALQEREKEIQEEKNRLQEDKIKCLNNLAASVAHQVRNPTLAIGGFAGRLASLLRKNGIESSYPDIIREEAQKLERIVKAMSRFNALSKARVERVNLREILEQAAEAAEIRARLSGKSVQWRRDLPDAFVNGDQALLREAFGEILNNAVDHGQRQDVEISLTLREADGRVEASIADAGEGIPETLAPLVFDPFFSTQPNGVGIGLTLAQEIILEHDGGVMLDRAHSPGTRIVVSIAHNPVHGFARAGASAYAAYAPAPVDAPSARTPGDEA